MRTTIRMWALGACALAAGWTAEAMPTRAEFQKMLPVVRELSADDTAAVRAGKMTPAEAGDNALRRAEDPSMDEASRYLFFEAAFAHYVKAAEYDKAADLVGKLRASISEVPDTAIVELIERNMKGVTRQEAQRLHALWRKARLAEKYARRLDEYRKSVKDASADKTARLHLAVSLVLTGDWDEALQNFEKCGGEVADVAKLERSSVSSAVTSAKSEALIADFWWNYIVADAQFLDDRNALEDAFKAHAAVWYKQALEDGAYAGAQKLVVEKRLASVSVKPTVKDPEKEGDSSDKSSEWRVVSLSKGGLKIRLGEDEWLEFIKCPAGTLDVGRIALYKDCPHLVKITRPFWIAKFPLTDGQRWALLGGKNKSMEQARDGLARLGMDQKQVEKAMETLGIGTRAYLVQGKEEESGILDKLASVRASLGKALPDEYVIRLPTEAEWLYAVSAGGTDTHGLMGTGSGTDLPRAESWQWVWLHPDNNKKDPRWNLHSKYPDLRKESLFIPCGKKIPNKWGLYDCFTTFLGTRVLDCGTKGKTAGALAPFSYKSVETDPLHVEGPDPLYLGTVSDMGEVVRTWRRRAGAAWDKYWSHPRLVIAPDVKLLNVYPKKK